MAGDEADDYVDADAVKCLARYANHDMSDPNASYVTTSGVVLLVIDRDLAADDEAVADYGALYDPEMAGRVLNDGTRVLSCEMMARMRPSPSRC